MTSMAMQDMRVVVQLAGLEEVPAGYATLREGEHFLVEDGHPSGCACCAARNPAGRALAQLLQDRARGKVAFFHGVRAVTTTAAGRALVIEALRSDPVASACFRMA